MRNVLLNVAAAARDTQRAAVVQSLRVERLSRSGLVTRLQISSSLVTRLVRGLIDDGLIRETGSVSSTMGRPPVELEIAADYGHIVAMSCEGERTRVGIYDMHGVEIYVETLSLDNQTFDVGSIAHRVDDARMAAGLVEQRLLGIAVSVPGVVEADTGAVSEAPDLGWRVSVPLRRILEDAYDVPVTVDNDVNLLVIAEREVGGGIGLDDVVYLFLGRRGVGAGIVSGGRLAQGGHGAAGEVGMIPLSIDNSLDELVRIEDKISVAAIRQAMEKSGLDAGSAPVAALVRFADDQCEKAGVIRRAVFDALAQSILILAAVLDPCVVLLGGAASELTAADLAEINQRLSERIPAPPAIGFAKLGPDTLITAAQGQCWNKIIAGGL